MKNLKYLIIFLFILICTTVKAQTQIYGGSTVNKSLLPHSPNAESLGKFGDIPIGIYTGVPNISVPICEIKLKKLIVPISIDYHSSGIKVDEIASSVGLGWALNAGGVINQIVYGKSDLDYIGSGGWLNPANSSRVPVNGVIQSDFGLNGNYSNNPQYTFDKAAADGLIDTQPDLFSFNIPGKSGKFFFDQDNGIHLVPNQNIKIQFTSQNFVITNDDGNKYYFSASENTQTIPTTGCSTGPSPGNTPSISWTHYLSKIVTPINEEIDFNYSNITYSIQNQIQETRYWYTNINRPDTAHYSYLPNCTTGTSSTVMALRLDNITNVTTGDKVVFTYNSTNWLDIQAADQLDKIEVFNAANTTIKRFDLFHSYFTAGIPSSGNTSLDNRLKLNGIQEYGQQPYVFSYNPLSIPPRLSFAQDYWGYYNGAVNNTTLLPNKNTPQFSTGANRNLDTAYMKAGILTQINYPTGGITNFFYETNDYYQDSTITTYHNENAGGSAVVNSTNTINFTVPSNATNFLARWTTTADGSGSGGLSETGDNTQITLTGPNNYNIGFTANSPNNGPVQFQGNSADGYNLIAGNYTITISNTSSTGTAYGSVLLTWMVANTQHVQQNALVGGLRIKSITNSPISGLPVTKHFEYTLATDPSKSSGIVQYTPQYDSDYFMYEQNIASSTNTYHMVQCDYIVQSSGSIAALGTMQGGSVSYTNVNVYEGNKTNGYTANQFSYHTSVPYAGDYPLTNPFPPTISNDWLNGLPVNTTDYKYNNVSQTYFPVKINSKSFKTSIGEGSNQYNVTGHSLDGTENYVRGAKITYQYPEWLATQGAIFDGTSFFFDTPIAAVFFVGYYHLYSSWYHLDQEINTQYDQNGLNPIATTTNYYYDNPTHLQLTRTITTRSDGKVLTASTTYPDDYAAGTQFLDDMKTNHLTALPVEQVSYLNDGSGNSITSGLINQYQPGGKGLTDQVFKLESASAVPLASYKFSNATQGQLPSAGNPGSYGIDSHYVSRLTYNQYDALGNPLQITPSGSPSTVYLWGYNNTYPIAQIKNTTYQAVANVLSQSVIDQLAGASPGDDNTVRNTLNPLRAALPGAEVTTYTYSPLVGMTSQTDPKGQTTYYEYDSFQRLMNIKDKDGNIIKHTDYHYQNQ